MTNNDDDIDSINNDNDVDKINVAIKYIRDIVDEYHEYQREMCVTLNAHIEHNTNDRASMRQLIESIIDESNEMCERLHVIQRAFIRD